MQGGDGIAGEWEVTAQLEGDSTCRGWWHSWEVIAQLEGDSIAGR